MVTICAYCKALIKDDGKPIPQYLPANAVNHGLCSVCEKIENMKVDQFAERMKKIQDGKNSACKE